MNMSPEFVNVYLAKQRDLLNDVLSKNLVLETTVFLTEQKLKAVMEELERLRQVPLKDQT